MNITGGTADVTTYFVLRLAATGVEATGLDVTTFDLQYVRTGAAPVAKVDATALAATDSAHADNKAIEIDATDQPGLYRVDWPDAAFVAGVKQVILTLKCATCFTEHLAVDIDPPVNLTTILGTAVSTPATAGILDVNVKAVSADTTAADNLEAAYDGAGYVGGTIKPKVDVDTIKTQAVTCGAGVTVLASVGTAATSTAQTGDSYAIVNGASGLVNIKTDTAAILVDTGTTLDGRIPAALTANGNMKCSLMEILTTALTETAGLLAGGFKKFFNVAAPTATCLSLPNAVPGANGGLPTTNGTKVSQTVDLTASQSIACSDKTGFSLSATGADLILKSSTFVQAIVAAINEFATYGLTAINTLLVTTGIKAATIPNATLANGAHGGAATVITLQTPIEANVASETNHDFTALQKTSLNAATPASVQNIAANGSGFTALGDTRIANLDATVSSRTKPADTQAAVTTVATTTNLTNLPTIPNDWLAAAGVKADAVIKIQAGLATPTNITAASGVALVVDQAVNVTKVNGTSQTAKDLGALNVTGLNTLAGHDPGATLVKVADLPASIAVAVGGIQSTSFAAGAIDAAALSADAGQEIADAHLDRADAIETGLTPRQAQRLEAAALAGRLSGAATATVTIRNVGNTKDRIVAAVDTNGNRTTVTTDVT